jgi:ubiquinone/menaquinone biosynthesis C-methylase UbiE
MGTENMVTYEGTRDKYHGRMAENYEPKRKKQERWDLENEYVERLLTGTPAGSRVLDVPVGTGRFLPLYEKLHLPATGIDSSDTMLKQASKKVKPKHRQHVDLKVGDATKLEFPARHFHTVVCVRFLDLIPEDTMREVLRNICGVASAAVILTIRLGDAYVAKSNTATHDRKKFLRDVSSRGWKVAHMLPIFKQGWQVIKLERR